MAEEAGWSKTYRLGWLEESRKVLQCEGICCQGSFFEGKVSLHFIAAFVLVSLEYSNKNTTDRVGWVKNVS